MCGILGGLGNLPYKSLLKEGLTNLEYRGYDSCGIVYLSKKAIKVKKAIGKVDNLIKKIDDYSFKCFLGHSRWATNGEVSLRNAHPQVSNNSNLFIIHNGIAENASSIKKELLDKGFVFKSSTDTEVIVNLIQDLMDDGLFLLKAIEESLNRLEGEFAFALLDKKDEERIYFVKRGLPLLIGKAKQGMLICSDLIAFSPFIDKYIDLRDGDYGYIDKDNVYIYSKGKKIEPSFMPIEYSPSNNELGNYPHFLLKEIEETPKAIRNIIETYCPLGEIVIDEDLGRALREAASIELIGSGSSYNAARVGSSYFSKLGIDVPSYIASERNFINKPFNKETLYILISQSGESADLLSLLNKIHEVKGKCLLITNSPKSALGREADYLLDIKAGKEIAVPASKSYICSCLILLILSFYLSNTKGIKEELESLIKGLEKIISKKEEIEQLAVTHKNIKHAFLIGRGDELLPNLEGALKLKEVDYVHAEAISSGELKHGPLALINKDSLVITTLLEESSSNLNRSNLQEAISRKAKSIVISSPTVYKEGDDFELPKVGTYCTSLALSLFYDYFAYYLGVDKKIDVDRPSNLAKAVTSK